MFDPSSKDVNFMHFMTKFLESEVDKMEMVGK